MQSQLSPTLMVIDDDEVDLEAFRREAEKRKLPNELIVQTDGRAALKMLASDETEQARKNGLLVFLDINMPGMNGHQFLEELRSSKQLRRTIVFVLTTSDHEVDKLEAYNKNVAAYFVKSKLQGAFDTLESYIQSVEFPPL